MAKKCRNCPANMEYNSEEGRWECNLCGYAEEDIINNEIPSYIK